MRKITLWQASDGKRFLDKRQCAKYEELIAKIMALMAELPPRPTDTEFLNGKGFVEHQPHLAKMVRRSLLLLTATLTADNRRILEGIETDKLHPSFIGAVISELDMPALEDAWYRFMCMSKDFSKEYEQPYYRDHEDAAERFKRMAKDPSRDYGLPYYRDHEDEA